MWIAASVIAGAVALTAGLAAGTQHGTTRKRVVPPASVSWQWVLGAPFEANDPYQLGINRTTYEGRVAPAPLLYDIDGFSTDAATVSALHDRGAIVVCYIETGGWESYRPDAQLYPQSRLGLPIDGYPDERYVDIRSPLVFERVAQRVRMCAEKGFDAIEPDIDDSYREITGFPLTQSQNLAFNRRVAALAHSLGMSVALKNGDDVEFAAAMEPIVDFAVVEQCFEFGTCDSFRPFVQAGKAVLEVEYELDPSEFCSRANAMGFSAVRQSNNLEGGGTPCR